MNQSQPPPEPPAKPSQALLPLLRRLAAFTEDPAGGNPAGVWIGQSLPEPREMQRIAAEVGYSETAFLAPLAATKDDGLADDGRRYEVRYYSPEAEVTFCGHATIASGVLLGELHGEGRYALETSVGEVPVVVERQAGQFVASLTSVTPRHVAAGDDLLGEALAALGWHREELDPAIPPAVAFAGAHHLVLAVRDPSRLAELDYDFERLKAAMLRAELTTLQLVWRESAELFHSRNPFPVGGVVEDPATGAAAAALGGYLRDARLLSAPASFLVRQGEAMGRPSRLTVSVPAAGGVTVTGAAVPIDSPREPPIPDVALDVQKAREA